MITIRDYSVVKMKGCKTHLLFMRMALIFIVLLAGFLFPIASHASAEMLHNVVLEKTGGRFVPERGFRFPCPVFGRCNHRIIGVFLTHRAGAEEAWIIAAIPNETSCHACMSRLTLEIYRKKRGTWRKYRVWRNFTEAGNWGVVDPEWIRLGKIDDRRMIFFLHSPFLQMGIGVETLDVFIVDDKKISPAGQFCLSYNNEGANLPDNGMDMIKWGAQYALVSLSGQPKLSFTITGNKGPERRIVVYDIKGKSLHLATPSDPRLRIPCGAHLDQ